MTERWVGGLRERRRRMAARWAGRREERGRSEGERDRGPEGEGEGERGEGEGERALKRVHAHKGSP